MNMTGQSTPSLRDGLLKTYETLESEYKPSGVDVGTYTTPVNFKESLTVPIHRWYGYKEGFSPSFVKDFIMKHRHSENDVIFDPFGGVGTTGLEAIIMGHNSYLMDVNPLGLMASRVKTAFSHENVELVTKSIANLKESESYPILLDIPNPTVKKYFAPITWSSLLQIKSFIKEQPFELHDFFTLALLSLIEEISTHHKNGNGVKKKRFIPEPSDFITLRDKFVNKVELYLSDMMLTQRIGKCEIFAQSNLLPYSLPNKADIVLTSPPYANCFDYSKVYLTELWVGGFFGQKSDQTSFRENSIISHVHYRWKPRNEQFGSKLVNDTIIPILQTETLWSPGIIPMLQGYFSDMGKFLANLSENLNDDATVGIVVGNSVYGGTPIATDLILAKQAEDMGFVVKQIKVYRRVIASSQQMVRLSEHDKRLVRESLIVLKWRPKV